MFYVYLLESITPPGHHYTGLTGDLRDRLHRHNSRQVVHTAKYAPWKLTTYVAFNDRSKAAKFERYLKSGSGRAFVKKRF